MARRAFKVVTQDFEHDDMVAVAVAAHINGERIWRDAERIEGAGGLSPVELAERKAGAAKRLLLAYYRDMAIIEGLPAALRLLRERAKLSRVDLGMLAGVRPETISRYEHGKVPDLPQLGAVLFAMGLTFRDLQDALDEVSPPKRSPNRP